MLDLKKKIEENDKIDRKYNELMIEVMELEKQNRKKMEIINNANKKANLDLLENIENISIGIDIVIAVYLILISPLLTLFHPTYTYMYLSFYPIIIGIVSLITTLVSRRKRIFLENV